MNNPCEDFHDYDDLERRHTTLVCLRCNYATTLTQEITMPPKLRLLSWFDVLQPGDLAWSAQVQEFIIISPISCGLTVDELYFMGREYGRTWLFYRPEAPIGL